MTLFSLQEVESQIASAERVRDDENGMRRARPGRYTGDELRLARALAALDDLQKERAKIVSRPSTQLCHALGCTRRVDPRHLMCAQHWRHVPEDLRVRLRVHGGESLAVSEQSPPELLDAARCAVSAVANAQIERRLQWNGDTLRTAPSPRRQHGSNEQT